MEIVWSILLLLNQQLIAFAKNGKIQHAYNAQEEHILTMKEYVEQLVTNAIHGI